jgi:hypothetical protein
VVIPRKLCDALSGSVAAENALELEQANAASRLQCQAGHFEVEKMQLCAKVRSCAHSENESDASA